MSNVENESPVDEKRDKTSVEIGDQDGPKPSANAAGEGTAPSGIITRSKETAVEYAHGIISGIEKGWQGLETKTASGTEKAKADFKKAKDQMGATLGEAKEKLIQAKNASGEIWQDSVKPGLDEVLKKARKIYKDTAENFKGT